MKNTDAQRAGRSVGSGLKYIDHPDLHDPVIAGRLIAKARRLLDDPGEIGRENEASLFKAMHACAHSLSVPRIDTEIKPDPRTGLQELHKRIENHLFQANIGLVYEMRRRSRVSRSDDDGLNSEGLWALYQTIRGFDPWRGYRFSTYACTSIIRAFLLVTRAESRRKERALVAMERSRLRATPDEGGRLDEELLLDRVDRAVAGPEADLTPTERFVIERRFLQRSDVRRETLEAIGKLIKVSKERVRQIELAGLAKLRTTLRRDPLFDSAGMT